MHTLLRRTLPVLVTTLVAGVALTVGAGTASASIRPNIKINDCQYTNSEPELQYGNTGLAVEQAQCELNWIQNGNNSLAVDGIFGQDTLSWVEDFQSCAGIGVDGIIGPQTWGTLDNWIENNNWCGKTPSAARR